MIVSLLLEVIEAVLWPVALLCAAWTEAAIYFDSPWSSWRRFWAATAALAFVAAVVLVPGGWHKLAAVSGGFLGVLAWWLTLQPSNTRDWQPNVARTAWAEIEGDLVTLHNVRNCDYRTNTDYTPRWETRTVRLSQITGIDLATAYWGSPWITHIILSFQFVDALPLCFSIETRMEVGETYSALAGFFRLYELIYVVADERDVLRVRTNFRRNEDVYLYRTAATPAHARTYFLEYLVTLNRLHERPRWYHAVAANCLTSIRGQNNPKHRVKWDWRLLVNGQVDQLLFARHNLVTDGLAFPELKTRAHINPAAHAAGDSPEFSRLIRASWVQS